MEQQQRILIVNNFIEQKQLGVYQCKLIPLMTLSFIDLKETKAKDKWLKVKLNVGSTIYFSGCFRTNEMKSLKGVVYYQNNRVILGVLNTNDGKCHPIVETEDEVEKNKLEMPLGINGELRYKNQQKNHSYVTLTINLVVYRLRKSKVEEEHEKS